MESVCIILSCFGVFRDEEEIVGGRESGVAAERSRDAAVVHWPTPQIELGPREFGNLGSGLRFERCGCCRECMLEW